MAELLSSRENPLLQRVRRLATDAAAARKLGQIWLEGDHLVSAAIERGWPLVALLVAETAWDREPVWQAWGRQAARAVRVPDAWFKGLSGLESPAEVGAIVARPTMPAVQPDGLGVVLDRLQDPGNAGSILRSAAAFGARQVLAMKGTVSLWSPKVLRAGMGAHFALHLVEGLQPEDLAALKVPLLATSSHAGLVLGANPVPHPCAWVFGHEGQGVSQALMARCQATVGIPQPGGEESLNVAAAAAICLYSSALAGRDQ